MKKQDDTLIKVTCIQKLHSLPPLWALWRCPFFFPCESGSSSALSDYLNRIQHSEIWTIFLGLECTEGRRVWINEQDLWVHTMFKNTFWKADFGADSNSSRPPLCDSSAQTAEGGCLVSYIIFHFCPVTQRVGVRSAVLIVPTVGESLTTC